MNVTEVNASAMQWIAAECDASYVIANSADIGCTAADLVYGTSLRLPGDYVERLRSVMRNLRATPPRASPANSFIHPDLDKCDFVLVLHDAVRRPLQPPYDGPYKVLRRSDKDVVIDRNGKTDTVSIDRVKPAFIDDSDHSSPQHCTPPQTLMPPPTCDSPPSASPHTIWSSRPLAQQTGHTEEIDQQPVYLKFFNEYGFKHL
nr:unnamed protein product [Spirometra erinaceieuropaei]